jgi:hypothetical protein
MAASIDNETRIALFKTIGLNEQKARETLKNHDVTRLLETTINEVRKFFSVFFSFLFFEFKFRRKNSFQMEIKFQNQLEIFYMHFQQGVNNKYIIYIHI